PMRHAEGTPAERARLVVSCADRTFEDNDGREYPARRGTSRRSQDLNYGTIGVREVTERVDEALADAEGDDEREAVDAYRRELAFGEFYTHVLFYNPGVVTRN